MADLTKERFQLFKLLRLIVAPDAPFFYVAAIYAVAISVFTLAVPLSVQVLIEAVANTTVMRAVVVLSFVLFAVLALSGLLVALQVWAMEVFERRFFARMTSEIALRLVYADHEALQRRNRDDLMNRYFEIMNLQKTLPAIAVGGTTLLLQTIVGYVVVSFYHPVFFAFSIAHALLVYLVWRIVDRQATASAIDISSAKLDMADWLESI
ncbi:MAG: ABC transporter transmembrane domain-containing protein, partial [Pseudomonadota bacterium]